MEKINEYIKKHGSPFDELEIEMTTNKNIIKAAYKELAKIHHPDKGLHKGDNRKFIALKKAYDMILENIDLWGKYIEAKKYHTQQREQQSKEMRQFQDDLLRREKMAEKKKQEEEAYKQMKLQEELNELNQQRLKEEEQKKNKEQKLLQFELENKDAYSKLNSIKVIWKSDQIYTQELLELIFKQYGPIKQIKLKQLKAIIEFHTTEAANHAVEQSDQQLLKVKYKMKKEKREKLQQYLKNAKDRIIRPNQEVFNLNSDTLQRIAHFYNKDSHVIINNELDLLKRQQERQKLMEQILQEELNN